ncbi:maleylpyruvate isomerase N-terminal domain-containing protein [Phycicoccus endophyticus]|uniref:Maleylpyruvate isomerase N-terminal domain-containing protein n=1 Tax=Phycicoccus endophyticus TaxID=1690220 RepID=A0A7G9R406_9MICO|nr:maleylpyruvate isomerase N-terminal domain-containing protein [Phycicoccus endophyticus]NHI18170.1 hypothetical protein [Phycicoccus endophyticus]QNN50331.1 maleylpyruvate isomerase N-terminal domain-containing protein [Phycicoccus endophyticus]GGL25916.1 maleylpyruvate isomerase [Phycicoccus endophyticus]
MGVTIPHPEALTTFGISVRAFLEACTGLEELDLLAPSRCRGWLRLDVVTHVVVGWEELLGGFATPTSATATVDAATYWRAYAQGRRGTDPVLTLMDQRRHTDAYRRPAGAVEKLRDLGHRTLTAADALREGRHLFQGHVLTSGDLLASWAVENVVHHLDLLVGVSAPTAPLRLARATVESLLDEPLPDGWDDVTATLVATGRVPVPAGQGHLADRLPVLG